MLPQEIRRYKAHRSSISIIKGMNISKKIVEYSRPNQYGNLLIMKNSQRLFHLFYNSCFRKNPLVHSVFRRGSNINRILAEYFSIQFISRIVTNDLFMCKFIIKLTDVMACFKGDFFL